MDDAEATIVRHEIVMIERLIAHEDRVIDQATAARAVAMQSRRRYVVKLRDLHARLGQ